MLRRTDLAVLWLPLGGCFATAPTIEIADDSGSTGTTTGSGSGTSVGSDTGTDTETSVDFCAEHPQAIQCFDFEASTDLPTDGSKLQDRGGSLAVVGGGFESSQAMSASLSGMVDGVATLRIDHSSDDVEHAFALRLEPGCSPPNLGVALASFTTFAGTDQETARLELLLLPDQRLGVRRRALMDEPLIAVVPSPPLGAWAKVTWTVSLRVASVDVKLSNGQEDVAGMIPGLIAPGAGRSSAIGLASPAATTCTVLFDNVVFGPPSP